MIQTPYSDRLAALRQRLDKHPNRKGLQKQVSRLGGKNQQYKSNLQAPTPYSGEYDSTVAGLNQNYNSSQADLAGQGLALEQQYGFGSDQSNPYSVARQLERKNQQERMGINTTSAASGHLYDGSTSNAYANQAWNQGQAQDSALRDYLGSKASLASQGVNARNDYEQGVSSAYAQRLQDALNQPPDPTEATGPRRRNNQNRNQGQNRNNNNQRNRRR